MAPGPSWVAASLIGQHGFSHVALSSAQATTNCKLLYNIYQVAWFRHKQWLTSASTRGSPKRSQKQYTQCWLQNITEHHTIRSTSDTHKGWSPQAPEPYWGKSCSVGQPQMWSWPVLTGRPSYGQPHPLICQQQTRLNHNRKAYKTNIRNTLGTPISGDPGHYASGPHRAPTT